MHLIVVLAFAALFWQSEYPGRWVAVRESDVWWTLALSVGPLPLLTVLAAWATRRAQRLIKALPEAPQVGQFFHHRSSALLRSAALAAFAASLFLTNWPRWFYFSTLHPALQIIGDLIVLTPFLAALIFIWMAAYPLDRAMRGTAYANAEAEHGCEVRPWTMRTYLDFHVRHHLLIVAAPMTLILFAANLTRGYEEPLADLTGWPWTGDAALGIAAAVVFVTAPLLLRRIWRTAPLPPGALRDRLEAICRRVNLRCRDILIWNSDGVMINAAVMGLLPRMRYVLLSDALLATMDHRQIEAVFGHEAGHVRHRHIQHFLVFAFLGWVLVAGVMEGLAFWSRADVAELTTVSIQGSGVAATVLFWGVGFGWLSRRFERQADMFGAQCVTPGPEGCALPCSVHTRHLKSAEERRVCMTGAATFASALDRVASLNGIPHEERSWRHSSIGSRIRFLMSLAGDPGRAASFDRMIRRTKRCTLVLALIGAVAAGWYWLEVLAP